MGTSNLNLSATLTPKKSGKPLYLLIAIFLLIPQLEA